MNSLLAQHKIIFPVLGTDFPTFMFLTADLIFHVFPNIQTLFYSGLSAAVTRRGVHSTAATTTTVATTTTTRGGRGGRPTTAATSKSARKGAYWLPTLPPWIPPPGETLNTCQTPGKDPSAPSSRDLRSWSSRSRFSETLCFCQNSSKN